MYVNLGGDYLKVVEGFMLREIAGSWIVVPIGHKVVEFNGLMNLSESGAFLWKKLEEGAETQELREALLSEYDIDEDTAAADISEFLSEMRSRGLLEE